MCDRNASWAVFWYITTCAVGETLFRDKRQGAALVNGVSSCVRGDKRVVKIWLKDCSGLFRDCGIDDRATTSGGRRADRILQQLTTHVRERMMAMGMEETYHILHRSTTTTTTARKTKIPRAAKADRARGAGGGMRARSRRKNNFKQVNQPTNRRRHTYDATKSS